MLDPQKSKAIIELLKSQSMEDKLKAIVQAKEHMKTAFSGEMTEVELANSVQFIEECYNIIREALGIEQLRIKADIGASVSKKKEKAPKGPKTAKSKTPQLDLSAVFEVMQRKLEAQKKNEPNT